MVIKGIASVMPQETFREIGRRPADARGICRVQLFFSVFPLLLFLGQFGLSRKQAAVIGFIMASSRRWFRRWHQPRQTQERWFLIRCQSHVIVLLARGRDRTSWTLMGALNTHVSGN
jgi:hypothetical protein